MTSIQFNREEAVEEGASFEYPLPIFVYECAVNAFRVLLGEVGLHQTIEATRHYNNAWGRAVVGMVKERLGEQETDLENIAMTINYAFYCTSMGHIRPLEIREGGAIGEVYACPNPGMKAPPEMCVAMTHVMAEGCCQLVNPEYVPIYTHHLAYGDDCCRYVVMKKASKFTLDDLGRLLKTIPLELSDDEAWSFATRMVIFGQLFTFTTVSDDLFGSQRFMELVTPLARETGLRLGAKLIDEEEEHDLLTIEDKLDVLGIFLEQSGAPSVVTESSIEKEITDCPCKGAPPEVCKQIEMVFNGVCEAINPDYEFSYDRMMSKGEHTCHWTVKKKREKPEEIEILKHIQETQKRPDEDLLKVLKMRLAKGEITEAEYDRLRDKLSK